MIGLKRGDVSLYDHENEWDTEGERTVNELFEILGGDGEELDVYLIGVNEPVERFTGRIIGIAHRENDIEDKLIMAPPDKKFTRDEVERAVHFQEQYYNTQIELIE